MDEVDVKTSRVEWEASNLWAKDHPELFLIAVENFMDKHSGFKITATTRPGFFCLTAR